MSLNPPLVSIISPVYNGGEFLEPMIQSVQSQQPAVWEHIVIDDGSNDGITKEVLSRYPHLRFWSRENKGQYATMNEGLRAAKGEWVCFISADDLMAENTITAVKDFVEKNPESEVIYGKTLFIREDGQRHAVQNAFQHVRPGWFLYLMGIYHCSMFVQRSRLLEKELWFDETLKYSGDYDWIVRLIRAGLKFDFLDKTLASLRMHPGSTSVTSKAAQDRELAVLCKRHQVNPRLFKIVATFSYLRSVLIEILYYLSKGQFSSLMKRIRDWYKRVIWRA